MFKLIIAITVFLIMFIPYAKADELWLQIGSVSKHSNSIDPETQIKFNERHPGIGLEYYVNGYRFTVGKSKNSYSRYLTYTTAGKSWQHKLSNNLSFGFNAAVGFYEYEMFKAKRSYTIDVASDEPVPEIINVNDPRVIETIRNSKKTNRGAAPWLSLSMHYKKLGVNLSYVPEGIIDKALRNVIVLQFKIRLN